MMTLMPAWILLCSISPAYCYELAEGRVFSRGDRMLFENCTFECEPADLNGNCVYLNCRFVLFGNTVLEDVYGTGVVFLNCHFTSEVGGTLFMAAHAGQITLVDCSFDGKADRVEWAPALDVSLRCYQSGVTLGGKEILVSNGVLQTVTMEDHGLLDAYKFTHDGVVYYNIFNLLSGDDRWDPLEMRSIVSAAEEYSGRSLTGLPVTMTISPTSVTVDGTVPDMIGIKLSYSLMSGSDQIPQKVFWEMSANDVLDFAPNTVTDSGCSLFSTQQGSSPVTVTVSAVTEYGLEASTTLLVTP